MKRQFIAVLLTAFSLAAAAQYVERPGVGVVAYYDESDIAKEAYRESPYYLELSGSWRQQSTDSSLVYTRQIDVEKSWHDYRAYLNVRCGRACRVLLNGKEVGYADDSRHWNAFFLDRYLKYGKPNTLSIETLRHSQGALLEDSALAVGLNGEPFILFKNDPCVLDLGIVADYDATIQSGTLSLDAVLSNSRRKGRYYLEVEILDPRGRQFDRMGRWVIFDGRSEEQTDLSRSWSGVEAWTAETPTLYTAIVRLRNEKMEEEEVVGARFGFRRVEVRDGILTVNGHAVTLRGITYGLEHTEGYASREQMRRDVLTIKQNNINAVRTTRFSPMDPYFYSLCDEHGLYVVADANLLPLSTQHKAVATDKDFIPLFEKRVEHLYSACRNHASIILWSLGNTNDNGVCMTAAYKRLKALDPTRPVLFAGAGFGETTDIIAPVRPTLQSMRASLSKSSERPFVMAVAADAGNFADLEPLWRLVDERRPLQGGFVDCWPLSPTCRSELRHLFSPFDVSLSKITPDEGEFIVYNRLDVATLAAWSLEYTIYTNLRPNIIAGELPVAIAGGGSDKVSMRIPQLDLQPAEEPFIRFTLTHRRTRAEAGTVVFALPQQLATKPMIVNDGAPLSDSILAQIASFRPQLAFDGHPDWKVEVVDSLVRRPDSRTLCVDQMLRYTAPSGTVMCDVRSTLSLFSTGDMVVDYTLAPTDRTAGANLQPLLTVNTHADSISWFGLDREVLFSKRNSGIIGTYKLPLTNTPVERQLVRWSAVQHPQGGLFAQLLGQTYTLRALSSRIVLRPTAESCAFRLHLRPFEPSDDPADFAAVDFPRLSLALLDPPTITASEPRFSQPLTVTLSTKSSAPNTEIRYTLDGTEPTALSERYLKPFVLTSTSVVKARTFAKDMPPSFTATRKYSYDHIVRTTFSRKPNTPYNRGTDTILFDGERGTADDLTRGWLGFSGSAVATTVELAKPIDVDAVILRYAHSPETWAFAPQRVVLVLSSDGETFADTLRVDLPLDPADPGETAPRVVELNVTVDRSEVAAIRILPQTLGRVPDWHRAKGLKPWLLMDEIEIIEK